MTSRRRRHLKLIWRQPDIHRSRPPDNLVINIHPANGGQIGFGEGCIKW
ncbi:MAG TPA: hypothetical protein VGL72_30675 [Bryobacteraceae bacterium]